MSEEDIRRYLTRGPASPPPEAAPPVRKVPRRAKAKPADTFKDFSATHMFCPTCRQAMPVRQRLMLYLPDGDLYDYSCQRCGTSVGTRKAGR